MAYTVQRKDRFYVVAYGSTVRERRRWHPLATAALMRRLAERLEAVLAADRVVIAEQVSLGSYLPSGGCRGRPQRLQPTTAYRYQWMIKHSILRRSALSRCRSCTGEMLDRFYDELRTGGGADGSGSHPRPATTSTSSSAAALNQTVRQPLVPLNVADSVQPPRATPDRRSPSAGLRSSSADSLPRHGTSGST